MYSIGESLGEQKVSLTDDEFIVRNELTTSTTLVSGKRSAKLNCAMSMRKTQL